MSTLSNVNVTIGNNNLGRTAPSEDGTSLLVVSAVAVVDKITLGELNGPFYSLADAEAAGYTEDYDSSNTLLAWRHIADFFEEAGNGVELHVLPMAATATLTNICDKTTQNALKDALVELGGKVKLIGVTRVPDGAYTPTFEDQFDADLWTAVAKLQELLNEEQTGFRPARAVIEGRGFQGTASSAKDLRDAVDGLNSNRVGVVIYEDKDVADQESEYAGYAAVGHYLGMTAGLPVQRKTSRVKNGPVSIGSAALSNGGLLKSFTETSHEVLNAKGYISLRTIPQQAGVYINDDHAACPITDDYAILSRGRVIDKVNRIALQVYTEELNDDIELDPDSGKLAISTIKNFQQKIDTEVDRQMTSKGEIVSITTFVDPDQNVLSTDEIKTESNVLPIGYAGKIKTALAFENPLNNQ